MFDDILFWILPSLLILLILPFLVITVVLIEQIISAPKHSKERKKRFLILLAYLIGAVLLYCLILYLDSVFNGGIEWM